MEPEPWSPVLCFDNPQRAHSARSPTLVAGWVGRWPNPFGELVEVVTAEGSQQVRMPSSARFAGFVDFLQLCGRVFRLGVLLRDGAIWQYVLQVHEAEFARAMRDDGCVPGEVHVLALLHEYAKVARVCAADGLGAVAEDDAREPPLAPAAAWNAARPLGEAQRRAVAWMQRIERNVRERRNGIRYASCLPIAATGWAYDCTTNRLVRWERAAWLRTRYRGAVLADPAGAGKTACALHLIAAAAGEPAAPPCDDAPSSGATLVLVCADQAARWLADIALFLGDGVRVVSLVEKADLRRATFAQLRDAHVVLATTALLRSQPYTEALKATLAALLGHDVERRTGREEHILRLAARIVHVTRRPVDPPLVELFRWRRVVVDDAHEYFSDAPPARERLRVLRTLDADSWWGLTGAPERASVAAMQTYYFFLAPKRCDDAQLYHHHPCLQLAVDQLLLRSFSRSPVHAHRVHPFPLAGAAECATVEELVRHSLQHADANRLAPGEIAAFLRHRLRPRAARADGDGGEAARLRATFVERQLADLRNARSVCPVCLEATADAIGPCGHLYCSRCMPRLWAHGECAVCRAPLCAHSCATLSDVERSHTAGTRAFALLRLLDELMPSGRVAVVLQWKHAEEALAGALDAAGIVPVRPKQGRRMPEGDVVLVALDAGVAHVPACEARHVVFAHACDERVTPMQQHHAIGRLSDAPCASVHHLVAEGTIEHEQWTRVYGEREAARDEDMVDAE